LAGGEVDEMNPCAGGAGNGLEAWSFASLLLLQMRLYVHARLGAPEDDQIGHSGKMLLGPRPTLI
uniref:hypothetical protein n=1 Tax=Vibrio cholerae TaxID=666 RepID=UPI001F356EAB